MSGYGYGFRYWDRSKSAPNPFIHISICKYDPNPF